MNKLVTFYATVSYLHNADTLRVTEDSTYTFHLTQKPLKMSY